MDVKENYQFVMFFLLPIIFVHIMLRLHADNDDDDNQRELLCYFEALLTGAAHVIWLQTLHSRL